MGSNIASEDSKEGRSRNVRSKEQPLFSTSVVGSRQCGGQGNRAGRGVKTR